MNGQLARTAYLDGWRGLAVLLVLADHFGQVLWPPMQRFGSVGVDLFFSLSGWLMAKLLLQERTGSPSFVWGRLTRIYPGLLVFVLAMILAQGARSRPEEAQSALTLTLNYYAAAGGATGVLGHLWSVAVEAHTYLALLVIALVARRNRAASAVLAAMFFVAAVGRGEWLLAHHVPADHNVLWRSDVRCAPILAGFIAFILPRPKGSLATVGAAGGLVAALALEILTPPTVWLPLAPVLLGLGLSAVEHSGAPCRMLSYRPLTYVGVWSFSIYLWQQPLSMLAQGRHALLIPALGATLAFGFAGFWLIEKPARALLRHRPSGVRRVSSRSEQWAA